MSNFAFESWSYKVKYETKLVYGCGLFSLKIMVYGELIMISQTQVAKVDMKPTESQDRNKDSGHDSSNWKTYFVAPGDILPMVASTLDL